MAEVKVEYVPGDCEDLVQCRGHVDPEAFCWAAWEQQLVEVEPAEVEHMYCRIVPDRSGKSGGYYCYSRRPGRGAFPVTVAGVR